MSLAAYWQAVLLVVVSVLLGGCEGRDPTTGNATVESWPQTAIIADLSYAPDYLSKEQPLARLQSIGFDTVLLDASVTPSSLVQQIVESAVELDLRTVIRIDPSVGDLSNSSDGQISLGKIDISQVDALVLSVDESSDLEFASRLQDTLGKLGLDTRFIAQRPGRNAQDERHNESISSVNFDVTLHEDGSREIEELLAGKNDLQLSAFTAANPIAELGYDKESTKTQWLHVPHCRACDQQRFTEDIRLLAMAFTLAPSPVIGVIDDPFWQDVYTSLIQLRRQNQLIGQEEPEWYAVDDASGIIAYRFSKDGQHILVAINLSDDHHELPLPFGFMAVSKIQLWASYDPNLRQIVTSEPVTLPARSVVIVVDE